MKTKATLRVFLLEDSQIRRRKILGWLTANHSRIEIVCAESAEEAYKKLKGYYDLLLLDHDLGNRAWVSSEDENTGYQVAKHIIEEEIKYGWAIIHSLNQVGGTRMVNLLPKSCYIPYFLLFNTDPLQEIIDWKREPFPTTNDA